MLEFSAHNLPNYMIYGIEYNLVYSLLLLVRSDKSPSMPAEAASLK